MDETLENLEAQLREITESEKQVQTDKSSLQKKKAELLRKQYPTVYFVAAKPSDQRHVAHDVCCFSTREAAQKAIGSGSSTDYDDGVTWHYSIYPSESVSLTDSTMLDMNCPPSHFPYTGW